MPARGHVIFEQQGEAELECEQGGGVIEQRFAFEDGGDDGGEAERARDGGCGDGVGCGDDSAEQEAGAEVELGDEAVGEEGDAEHGEGDEPGGQHADAEEILAEAARVGLPRGGVEQRRKEDEEDDVRRERDARNVRKEREDQTCEHEQDGIRHVEASREAREEGDDRKQQNADALQNVAIRGRWRAPCDEYRRRELGGYLAEKLEPQPQDFVELGLMKLKPWRMRVSSKSRTMPAR